MSQENVDVVRAAYEALASRGLDAFSRYWAADIESHASEYATRREALEAVGLSE